MADIFDESVFAPVHTFMGAPQSWDLANAKAAVLSMTDQRVGRAKLRSENIGRK